MQLDTTLQKAWDWQPKVSGGLDNIQYIRQFLSKEKPVILMNDYHIFKAWDGKIPDNLVQFNISNYFTFLSFPENRDLAETGYIAFHGENCAFRHLALGLILGYKILDIQRFIERCCHDSEGAEVLEFIESRLNTPSPALYSPAD